MRAPGPYSKRCTALAAALPCPWGPKDKAHRLEGSVRMSKRLFILLRSFFLSGAEAGTLRHSLGICRCYPSPRRAPPSPSFLSILLIMRRSGSMYLESCFSLSRYCCSSAWLEPAGLMTELGFTAAHGPVSAAHPQRPSSLQTLQAGHSGSRGCEFAHPLTSGAS